MNYTHQEMLDLIQSARARLSPENTRELVLANTSENTNENSRELTSRSREVYKDINIKREKHISRSSEEVEALTSSPYGIPSGEVSPEGLEEKLEGENNHEPARTSSRVTGITAQHVRTKSGIKLNVAIQTEQDAEQGMFVELTAELKRHSRIRELKRYAADDYDFEQYYISVIEEIKKLKPEEGKSVCMGRFHVRGARGHWFANMMVVGRLDESNVLQEITIHINGDEFEIKLDGELSPNQSRIYYNTGIYGSLKSQKPAPRLETAKRKVFNP